MCLTEIRQNFPVQQTLKQISKGEKLYSKGIYLLINLELYLIHKNWQVCCCLLIDSQIGKLQIFFRSLPVN